MIILIDNGHGCETHGKCSPKYPDGSRYYEWLHCRTIARRIQAELAARRYDARLLTPEDIDVSLGTRVLRANKLADKYGAANVLTISIHSNAAGNGGWMNARGWSIYTSPGKTRSDDLATCIYHATETELSLAGYDATFTNGGSASAKQRPMRSDFSDGDPDFEAKFYILTKTKGPAVLSENLFHDNRRDVDFLLSEAGTNAIVQGHVNGIIEYIKTHAK